MDTWRRQVAFLVGLALMTILAVPAGIAQAHAGTDNVALYPPLQGTSTWARFSGSEPAQHHIVYSNYGYRNDWSVDVYAGPGGSVLSPFGSKTNTGHPTSVTVVDVRPGCATGRPEDGGYRMTLEARDTATGAILGRADLMHLASPRVGPGATVGPWTVLGNTSLFRNTSCYQVTNPNGVHIHLEAINAHRYSCYISRPNGTAVGDQTKIGYVAVHYAGQRAAC